MHASFTSYIVLLISNNDEEVYKSLT